MSAIIVAVDGEEREMRGVCAIIVTHNPDPPKLERLLDALSTHVSRVVIVDNASSAPVAATIRNETNAGIATALNQGIAIAKTEGFGRVVFFDQDSTPASRMIATLEAQAAELERGGYRVGAIGPSLHDRRTGMSQPFVKIGFPKYKIITDTSDAVECDFIITSGALISVPVLESIGPMADALFIDNVDTEWCFRATSKGYSLFGSNKAKLFHELGNRTITVAKRNYPVHNATRLYYIIRNPILLARMPHVPKKWVFQEILHIPLKLVIFSFFVADRSANARSILVGLWHGLIGRTGPMAIR